MYYYMTPVGVQCGTCPVEADGYVEITQEQYEAELAQIVTIDAAYYDEEPDETDDPYERIAELEVLEAAREAAENNWI